MPVRLLLLVALYCGVSVMHVRRILSYIKRKKVRDMTEKESDAFGDTDVWERGQVFVIFLHEEVSVPERAAQRNILLMLRFCCSEDLIEVSIMFHLKLNTCSTKHKCKNNGLVFLNTSVG